MEHGPARAKRDQMVAWSADDARLAQIATTLANGIDGMSERFDRQGAVIERVAEKFSSLFEQSATSTLSMVEKLALHLERLADRVEVLEAELAETKARARGLN
jgi:hypothetical protein